MKKIKANDLIVMYDVGGKWKAIAFATSCEIDISADTIETSSPDTGRWKTYKKRKLGWRLSSAYLLADEKKNPDVLSLLGSDTAIRVCFTTVEPHPELIREIQYVKDNRYSLIGSALMVRMTVAARKGDMVTMNAEMIGNGPLEHFGKSSWVFVNGIWDNSGYWVKEGIWK